ncbi:MAG TPA: hypothetical protein DCG06_03120, partial [Deltaproteobacteria bacterium]|nr:hypothetical protein [Deltaproteobacteria bacterium]
MKTLLTSFLILTISISASNAADRLSWAELPPLPNKSGVAGPFAGTHNDALIVAGGANFPQPVWENDKAWHDQIFVLTKSGDELVWKDGGKLAQPIAYGAAVSTPNGVVCMGGNDAETTFDDVFLLSWDASTEAITTTKYPSLPEPCAYGAATLVGDVIYLAGGQNGQSLETAMKNFWALELSNRGNPDEFVWKKLPAWPGPSRALNLTVSQHNGTDNCVYVISGRRQEGLDSKSVEFLKDVWEYTPAKREWRKRADAPRCVMAGTAIGHGRNQILVLGGADGSLFFKGDELKDEHPGFPKKALAYDTVADRWSEAGATPRNHVTTIAVEWDGAMIIPSGEVRPRVRSPKVWRVTSTVVADVDKADLCVYGGTSGGVVAAVQAARMGKRVALVEPGRHLGGMMAGGLSWSDVGSAERAKLFGGLAREVFQRIGKHYGLDPEKVFEIAATKIEGRSAGGVDFIRPPSLAFEPKVAERAFNELVREAGVTVLLESRARTVVKDGRRIVRIELEGGGAVTAKVFIDATSEGDLMALAGVSYMVGRESNEQYDETINGVRSPEHGPSSGRFSVNVDPFVEAGDPSSGLLPLIAGGAPESIGSADKRIQSYNFRLCLTDDPANR